MSIKLELDADSIKKAITTHISNQGFDLAGKTVEVALVNGRGGNGNRATVTISDEEIVPLKPPIIPKVVIEVVKELVQTEVEQGDLVEANASMGAALIAQEEVVIPDVDLIIAAAESSSDIDTSEPDDVMEDFFPKINPGDVEIPKSLF